LDLEAPMTNSLLFVTEKTLLGLGIFLLAAAIFPIRNIILRLPKSGLRRKWFLLLSLNLLFLLAYVGYSIVFWKHTEVIADLLVPAVFFFGAVFVWLISSLSLQTAIDVRRIYRLEEESITDSLTGVYNRRYLERRLGEEYSHAREFNAPLSILLIDVDEFKEINDNAGHTAGDQVIVKLAMLMKNMIRGGDVLVRFGGDEFLVIALNTPAQDAASLAEKLLTRVASQPFLVNGERQNNKEIHTTISVGVAELTNEVEGIDQLVSNADAALYCAKREGRNRTVVYPHFCQQQPVA
jgi:diguanylate cyclase (GGDEF)-like protein